MKSIWHIITTNKIGYILNWSLQLVQWQFFKIFKIGLPPFDTIFLTGPFTQICLTLIWIYIVDILCDHYKQANGGNHKCHDELKNCFIVKLSTKISGVSLADWFYVIFFLTEPSSLFTSTELKAFHHQGQISLIWYFSGLVNYFECVI